MAAVKSLYRLIPTQLKKIKNKNRFLPHKYCLQSLRMRGLKTGKAAEEGLL